MKFWKLHNCGNDFIFINNKPVPKNRSKFIRSICERRTGIGADGVVFFWNKNKTWHWSYYNCDGSVETFCGNASLSFLKLLSTKFSVKKVSWETLVGTMKAEQVGKRICVHFPLEKTRVLEVPQELTSALLELNDQGLSKISLINAGVPHLVLENHDVWPLEVRTALSAGLRNHPSLQPKGSNVTWLSKKSFETVSFERGIEGETLGCGSGALAAFISLEQDKEQKFQFPGGKLWVEQKGDVYLLKGQPELVFEGIIR